METFGWVPDWGLNSDSQPRVRVAKFGDGYEQRVQDGLNPLLPTWQPRFTGRNRALVDAIEDFLSRHGASTPFLFSIPESRWTAESTGFGYGDGLRTQFQLAKAPGLAPEYTRPRVNDVRLTGDPSAAPWERSASGSGSAPQVSSNHAPAPDGTLTAALVTLDVGTGTGPGDVSRLRQPPTAAVVGQEAVFSVWLRTADGSTARILGLERQDGSDARDVTGEWRRLEWPCVPSPTAVACSIGLYGAPSLGTSRRVSLLVWAPQVELGGLATRPVPNASASAHATDVPAYLGAAGSPFVPVKAPWATRPSVAARTWAGAFAMSETPRRNLLARTTNLLHAAWSAPGWSRLGGQSAPDSSTTAVRFTPSVGSGPNGVRASVSAAPGQLGLSVFVSHPVGGHEYLLARVEFEGGASLLGAFRRDGSSAFESYLDHAPNAAAPAVSCAYTTTACSYDAQGSVAWYRASMAFECTAAVTGVEFVGSWTDSPPTGPSDGSGAVVLWGPMLEPGAIGLGRYIPNTGDGPGAQERDYALLSSGLVVLTQPLPVGGQLAYSGAGDDTRKVVCDRWSRTANQYDNYSLQADFREVIG